MIRGDRPCSWLLHGANRSVTTRRTIGRGANSREATVSNVGLDRADSRAHKPAPLICRARVSDLAATVATHSYVGLLGVGQEAFKHAQTRAVLANHGGCFVGEHLLIGAGLDKLAAFQHLRKVCAPP